MIREILSLDARAFLLECARFIGMVVIYCAVMLAIIGLTP